MKLSIDRATLLKSLSHVQSIVEKRNTIPILSHVQLSAKEGQLHLTATDMDIDIVESVDANVQDEGQATAPAHTLYEIVRKLPDGAEIELVYDKASGQMAISAGRSNFSLSTLPVEDFPALNSQEFPHSFALPAEEMKTLIDRTRFAVSTEETRYYLNGIFLHAANNNDKPVLRAVATDGHRLARMEMPLPEGAAGIPGVIMPRKTINELRKLVDETEGNIDISVSDARIRFAFDSVVLTSKLIDGTFPDYERVIPTNNTKILVIGTQQFAAAVDRVATISSERSRAVKLQMENKNLTLTANSPENGTATEELEVDYKDDPIEIGFNSKYLLDMTQQIEGDSVQLSLSDSASPTIVTDMADESTLYVLMPMRV